jgi:hypothetical protein
MNPYTMRAIAVRREADMQAEAASERLARQARTRRAAAAPPHRGLGSVAPRGAQKAPRQRLRARWVSSPTMPI